MFILAHNDPVWIGVGILVGIAVGFIMVTRGVFIHRK